VRTQKRAASGRTLCKWLTWLPGGSVRFWYQRTNCRDGDRRLVILKFKMLNTLITVLQNVLFVTKVPAVWVNITEQWIIRDKIFCSRSINPK